MVDAWPISVFEGGVYRSRLPGAPFIVGDPALAIEVLAHRSADFPHGALFDRMFAPIWGKGILVSEAAEWRWQRHAAAPAFRPARMAALAPLMRGAAERALARWRPGVSIELHGEMRKLTLSVLLDAVLSGGEDFPDREEASRTISAFTGRVGQITILDVLPLLARWRPSDDKRGGEPAAYLRARVERMIARRRRDVEPRGDLVDLLMSARDPETGQSMDDALLRDNLIGFIAGGHETTSYTLSWALWLVASHPPTRERLLAEISNVAGEAPIGAEHLSRLNFTRQVISETMRLYPAAVAIARAAARDTQLGGQRLKQGASVLIATYALHRLANIWTQPEVFDPDRFAPEREGQRPPGSYLPFGTGPRVCMGAAFAMTELVVLLATLVRAMNLLPDPTPTVQVGVRLGGVVSTSGLWVTPQADPA